jgi:hypothetical protein
VHSWICEFKIRGVGKRCSDGLIVHNVLPKNTLVPRKSIIYSLFHRYGCFYNYFVFVYRNTSITNAAYGNATNTIVTKTTVYSRLTSQHLKDTRLTRSSKQLVEDVINKLNFTSDISHPNPNGPNFRNKPSDMNVHNAFFSK